MVRNYIKSLPLLAFTGARRLIYRSLGFVDARILKHANPVSVLTYHSVSNDGWRFSIDLKTLKKQIAFLKKNYQFITLKTLEKYINGQIKITKPSVVLTFDDGYSDVLLLKDYLKKQNIMPVLFLISDTKNVNVSEIGRRSRYLSKREIKGLMGAGWEIGCHSNTHADLSKLSAKELREEIVTAKKNLEKSLGIPIKYFAYPKGKYSKKAIAYVKAAKYKLGLTMDDGIIKENINVFTVPRIGIDRTHTFSEFKSAFSPANIKLRKIIKSTFIGRYL